MKILLFCHLGLIREYAEYINALKKVDSVQSLFLTMGSDEYELGCELGEFDEVKDILPGQVELDAADSNAAMVNESLKSLEARIGSNFVNRDILTDRFFLGRPRLDIDQNKLPLTWTGSRTKQLMHLVYKQLEAEIVNFQPDFMFVEPSFAPTRMAWRLAREHGVPAGNFMSVRFWPERLYLETGIGYDWQRARSIYDEMIETPMVGDELTQIEQRLQTIVEQKTKPAYLQTDHAKGAPNFFKRLSSLRAFSGHASWISKRALTFTSNPQVLPGKMLSPKEKYIRYWKGQKAKRYLQKHQTPFSEFKLKKYAVYFLHVEPELTVEGMAFDYQDQVNTLRNILASLPADMELVVKEHSPMLGYRPVGVYSQLVHMPGLIIAGTHEDSHQLITHASVVVTLAGTVALEAVLYSVPVIVLGSVYFDSFKGIYKPDGLGELKALLADPEQLTGATKDDALRMIGCLQRASEPGKPPRVDVSLADISLESAQAMMLELKRVSGKLSAEKSSGE